MKVVSMLFNPQRKVVLNIPESLKYVDKINWKFKS